MYLMRRVSLKTWELQEISSEMEEETNFRKHSDYLHKYEIASQLEKKDSGRNLVSAADFERIVPELFETYQAFHSLETSSVPARRTDAAK